MHVKGIGEKGYQRIKAYLRVAGAAAPASGSPKTPAAISGAKR